MLPSLGLRCATDDLLGGRLIAGNQQLLIVANGHDGDHRDASPFDNQMFLALVSPPDHVPKAVLGFGGVDSCDNRHGELLLAMVS